MKTKRILAASLSAALVLAAAPASLAADGSLSHFTQVNTYRQGQFTDVAASAWYQPNVAAAYNLGLMKGSSNTTFNPKGNLTIGEVVAMAARLHSIYYGDGETFPNSSPWYQTYVDYAEKSGIISDYSASSYTRVATRAEFAKIFAASMPDSALNPINSISALPDVTASANYYTSVLKLYNAGVLTGSDAFGTFGPNLNIDRGSAAAIVTRMANPSLRKTLSLASEADLAINYPYLTVRLGETETLSASANNTKVSVTWQSKQPAIATVSANGVVTAKAMGSAEIVGTTASGATVTCIVTCHDRYYKNTKIYDYAYITGAFCEGTCNVSGDDLSTLYKDYHPGYSAYIYSYDATEHSNYIAALKRAGFEYIAEYDMYGLIDGNQLYGVQASVKTIDGETFVIVAFARDSI